MFVKGQKQSSALSCESSFFFFFFFFFLQRVHILTTTYHKTFIVYTHLGSLTSDHWVGVRGGARGQNLRLPKYCF